MRPVSLLIVLLLLAGNVVEAFVCRNLRASTRMRVDASTEVAQAYTAIKEKAIGSLSGASIPPTYSTMLSAFLEEYADSCAQANTTPDEFKYLIFTWLKGVQTALSNPHKFAPFHKSMPEEYKWCVRVSSRLAKFDAPPPPALPPLSFAFSNIFSTLPPSLCAPFPYAGATPSSSR